MVAETGTLVVVESEGNGRMCLTLPETLISVVGIEKVVPTWQDLEVFLQTLPRSSTAERMNPYTCTWTGTTDEDGPQHLPPRPARQRPHRHPRRRGRPPGPALHPLLGLPQRLPRVRAGGRPRLRLRLPGPDRRHPHPAAPRHGHRARRLAAVRLLPVRRLLRGVPGRHRHPGGPRPSAGTSRAGRRGRPATATGWCCGPPRDMRPSGPPCARPAGRSTTRRALRAGQRLASRTRAAPPAAAARPGQGVDRHPGPARRCRRSRSATGGGARGPGTAQSRCRSGKAPGRHRERGGPQVSTRDRILGRMRRALADTPREEEPARGSGGPRLSARARATRTPARDRRSARRQPRRLPAPSSTAATAARTRRAARRLLAAHGARRVVVPPGLPEGGSARCRGSSASRTAPT